jgi:serine/threonine-protein kinase
MKKVSIATWRSNCCRRIGPNPDFYRERFRLEARAAARLNHANIVPLHTFGEHDGMLYYVMGYVEGESLADRLKREGHIDETEARRILVMLASALQYAHGRGVLHRDSSHTTF